MNENVKANWGAVLTGIGLLLVAGAAIAASSSGPSDRRDTETGSVTERIAHFRIYQVSTGGQFVWSDARKVTFDQRGTCSVALGETAPIPDSILSLSASWIGISIDGRDEMTPRIAVESAHFAYRMPVREKGDREVIIVNFGITEQETGPINRVRDPGGNTSELFTRADSLPLLPGNIRANKTGTERTGPKYPSLTPDYNAVTGGLAKGEFGIQDHGVNETHYGPRPSVDSLQRLVQFLQARCSELEARVQELNP